ncbi:MAG: DUF928 domain-containing protein [Leptolyngbyaceae cyanobacterium MAG.088]|nr:DUF928 domain-containing protein [Leptolyngbyaceae cyanobacterium MAG.088]
MFFKSVPKSLKLFLGLSVPFFLFRTYAYASVTFKAPSQLTPRLTQFEPTTTPPLDSDTDINTTGGRYFQPPDTQPFRGTPTTTGTRGDSCSNITDGVVLSGLGPRSIAGLTTSVRPEFVWYMTEGVTAAPVMFRLLELDENGLASVVNTANLAAQVGFMRYQLPEDVPPLGVGKDYLWQVIVRCDSERASNFWATTLSLQVVTPTPELTSALAMTTTNAEKAKVYGNAGIWYNALALVSTGNSNVDQEVRTGLLQDLATLESDDETFSTTLMTIVEQTTANP